MGEIRGSLLLLGYELHSSSSWSGLFLIFITTGLHYTAHENVSNLETRVLFEISIEATEGGLRLALAPTYLFFACIGYRIEADKTCS